MEFAPIYLIQRFFYRIGDFFHHWYVDGSRAIGDQCMLSLAGADESFAIAITLRHFFEPLYKDYSAVGRVLGVIFRTGRIIVGSVVYLFIIVFFAIVYAVWLAIPPAILFFIIRSK